MFCNKTNNNTINKIHSRTLQTVINDYNSRSISDLTQANNTITIHNQNIQCLMNEIYKCVNQLNIRNLCGLDQVYFSPYQPQKVKRMEYSLYYFKAVYCGITFQIITKKQKLWQYLKIKIKIGRQNAAIDVFVK